MKPDQAPSAILELVDGPKDVRFALTARSIARARAEGKKLNEVTTIFKDKVTKFRPNGEKELEEMIEKFKELQPGERDNAKSDERRWGGQV